MCVLEQRVVCCVVLWMASWRGKVCGDKTVFLIFIQQHSRVLLVLLLLTTSTSTTIITCATICGADLFHSLRVTLWVVML